MKRQEKHFFIGGSLDIREATIQLLKDLYASETGLLPYTLYKRYGVTPIVLVQIVKRLRNKGFIRLAEDNRLILTDEGKKMTGGYIFRLSNQQSTRIGSKYFLSISAVKLDRHKPFIPSKFFFERFKKEGDENG